MGVIGFDNVGSEAKVDLPSMALYREPVIMVDGEQPAWGTEELLRYWRPTTLRWGTNGEISTLGVEYVLGATAGKSHERPETLFAAPGDRFTLAEHVGGKRKEWFRGQAAQEQMLIQAQTDSE